MNFWIGPISTSSLTKHKKVHEPETKDAVESISSSSISIILIIIIIHNLHIWMPTADFGAWLHAGNF